MEATGVLQALGCAIIAVNLLQSGDVSAIYPTSQLET
jgi:hypothetical protein